MTDAANITQIFIFALKEAERTQNIEPLIHLFVDHAQVQSIALQNPCRGLEGVRKFWTDYLAVFKTVSSEFTHVHSAGTLAALEWCSIGTLPNGQPINYAGVTILEFEGDKICRLRTYYDSAAFIPDGAKLLGREMITL